MAFFYNTWACILLASVSLGEGMTLVNRKSGMCLDVFSPCVDGSNDKNCQKTPTKQLGPGSKLQLVECNGDDSQEFEFNSGGRVRNVETGLCVDISAKCKDHFRTPCERVAVTELKGKQRTQLYTCHEDTGILSNSYGNQKWNFEMGQVRNNISNLCLDATPGKASKNTVNVGTQTCNGGESQLFDFLAAKNSQAPAKKFQIAYDAGLQGVADSQDRQQAAPVPTLASAVAAAAVVTAAIVGVRWVQRDRSQVEVAVE